MNHYHAIIFTDATDAVIVQKTIGAYKIANELRLHGYNCLVVDHLHAFNFDELTQILVNCLSTQTLFVGFSTTFFNNTLVEPSADGGIRFNDLDNGVFFPQGIEFQNKIVKQIKTINSNCAIVLGGEKAHANYNNRQADYVVISYGEKAIINLTKHLELKLPLENSYKNIWGVTVIDGKLDKDYPFTDTPHRWAASDVVNAKCLPLELSRGCVFNCKFCSHPLRGKKNLDFVKNMCNLQLELQHIYDSYNIDTFYILDDTFNDHKEKLKALQKMVKNLSFQPLFWAYVRLDLIARDPEVFSMLYDIGLRACYFGIETLNERTGRLIGKGYSRRKQIDAINNIRKNYSDVRIHGSFIVGLPEESVSSVLETHSKIMNGEIGLHSFVWKPLHLRSTTVTSEHSDLDLNYKKYGYKIISQDSNKLTLEWENNHMNLATAIDLAARFQDEGYKKYDHYLNGQLAWALRNYDLRFDQVANIKWRDMNWTDITHRKEKFVNEYKHQLFKILNI